MLELGEQAATLHERVAQQASQLGIDLIVGVGPLFSQAVRSVNGLGFSDQEQLLSALPDLLKEGDTVLVKGSRGMRLERTIERIRSM